MAKRKLTKTGLAAGVCALVISLVVLPASRLEAQPAATLTPKQEQQRDRLVAAADQKRNCLPSWKVKRRFSGDFGMTASAQRSALLRVSLVFGEFRLGKQLPR